MRLLLDTHVLLWWLADDDALPDDAAEAIADPESEVFVSAATVWEIAIKQAAGKLDAPSDLIGALEINRCDQLAMTATHALAAGRLPRHHGDPFDRMIIAQAQIEGLVVTTVDKRFDDYEVTLLA